MTGQLASPANWQPQSERSTPRHRPACAPSARQPASAVTIYDGCLIRRAAGGRACCPLAAGHGSRGQRASTCTSTRSRPRTCRTGIQARASARGHRADREIHHGVQLGKRRLSILARPCRKCQPAGTGAMTAGVCAFSVGSRGHSPCCRPPTPCLSIRPQLLCGPKTEALDCTVLHCPTWISETGPVLTFGLTSCQKLRAQAS